MRRRRRRRKEKKREDEASKRRMRRRIERRRKRQERMRRENETCFLGNDISRSIVKNVFCGSSDEKRIFHALKSVLKDPKDLQEVSSLWKNGKETPQVVPTKEEIDTLWKELVDLILSSVEMTKKDHTIQESVKYAKRLETLLEFSIKHVNSERIISLTYGPHSSLVCSFLLRFSNPSVQHLG